MSADDEQTRAGVPFRYEILERLGGGAHGEGYLARRPGTDERVFLKVMRRELADDLEWAKRFCDEVSLLRSCVHPNIVRYVEAYQETSGELCLVTEFLEGEDLRSRLRKSGPLTPKHVVALTRPICDALGYLHTRGVVHRDLTPENILVSGRFPTVVPRLLDFGLAWSAGPREARTGATLAMTPLYAAPECLEGGRATAASDLYSLGVILYEALSGAPPFASSNPDELLTRQRSGTLAPLPPIAGPLLPVLRRCLSPDPANRFASAGELAGALEEAAAQIPEEVVRTENLRPKRPVSAVESALPLVGNYQLMRELGRGGMGYVYLARHVKLGRQVAIKMLRAEALADRDAVARFFNEARTVNAINHEHIVEIFDFVEEDGPEPRIYCVMELLVGSSLAQLRKAAPLPLARILHISRQVADALAAAHRAGVVHRDVKPANIFVTTRSGIRDYVKVLDFGIAKVNTPLEGGDETPAVNTQTGLSLGTPDYMSPEQVTAGPVDGRSDVFAFGVLLYELLVGKRPFSGANVAHVVVNVVREPHAPLPANTIAGEPLPAVLAELVDRCLEKRPEARPQSMEEVSASLDHLLQSLTRPADGNSGVAVALAAATGREAAFERDRATPMQAQPAPEISARASVGPTRIEPQVSVGPTRIEPHASVGPTRIDEVPSLGAPAATRVDLPVHETGHGSAEVPATIALPSLGAGLEAARIAPSGSEVPGGGKRRLAIALACAAVILSVGAVAMISPRAAQPLAESLEQVERTSVERAPGVPEPRAERGAPVASPAPVAAAVPAPAEAPSAGLDVAAPSPAPIEPSAAPIAAERAKAAPPAPIAPRTTTVTLQVRSEPEGAAVVHAVSGERLCDTPCAASLPHGESPVKLRVELAGHRPRTVSVTPNRDDALEVRLTAVRRRAPQPKAPKDPNAPLNPFD